MSFFKEGGTHYVGLAAHDASGPDLPEDVPLRPGYVFGSNGDAVFPGKNLSVRIEKTLLITETSCEIPAPGLPREICAIEASIRKNE